MAMARLNTLNVSLTPALHEYVRGKVSRGGYESASEVVRDALRALQDRERAAAGFWQDVRGKLTVAKRQAAAGRTVDPQAARRAIAAELSSAKPAARRRGKAA